MLGISINPKIGIGDGLQFSSTPENYYQETGKKLYDVSRPWFFDYNPYVVRDVEEPIDRIVEMWNFSPKQWEWPRPRTQGVYLSNAEIFARVLGVTNPMLNRPRLYRFETYPFEQRERILFQTNGKSHGELPEHIINHVLEKYRPTGQLYHIGPPYHRDLKLPHIETPSLWDLAETLSTARILICPDSGPSWVAACYPDVIVKKVRTKPSPEHFKTWVPLAIDNVHSHWDDRCHQIFNVSEHDVGFTWSYRRI